jgi:hypothetical protein
MTSEEEWSLVRKHLAYAADKCTTAAMTDDVADARTAVGAALAGLMDASFCIALIDRGLTRAEQ